MGSCDSHQESPGLVPAGRVAGGAKWSRDAHLTGRASPVPQITLASLLAVCFPSKLLELTGARRVTDCQRVRLRILECQPTNLLRDEEKPITGPNPTSAVCEAKADRSKSIQMGVLDVCEQNEPVMYGSGLLTPQLLSWGTETELALCFHSHGTYDASALTH